VAIVECEGIAGQGELYSLGIHVVEIAEVDLNPIASEIEVDSCKVQLDSYRRGYQVTGQAICHASDPFLMVRREVLASSTGLPCFADEGVVNKIGYAGGLETFPIVEWCSEMHEVTAKPEWTGDHHWYLLAVRPRSIVFHAVASTAVECSYCCDLYLHLHACCIQQHGAPVAKAQQVGLSECDPGKLAH